MGWSGVTEDRERLRLTGNQIVYEQGDGHRLAGKRAWSVKRDEGGALVRGPLEAEARARSHSLPHP